MPEGGTRQERHTAQARFHQAAASSSSPAREQRLPENLRRTVELAFGVAQVRLVDLHVHHALRFVRDLVATHDTAQAVDIYAEMTGVPEPTRQILYARVLDRLAAHELPGENVPSAQPTTVSVRRPRRRPRMPQRAVA